MNEEDVAAREEITKKLRISARCAPLDEDVTGPCLFTGKSGRKIMLARSY